MADVNRGNRPLSPHLSIYRPQLTSITESLNARLSLDLFHGDKDEFQGNEIANTGSTVLSLTPALIYSINDDFSASASILIPVHRRVNETALTVGPLWSLGLSCSF